MGCKPSSADVSEPVRRPSNELHELLEPLRVREHTPHVSRMPTSHASVKPTSKEPRKHRDVMSIFAEQGMILDSVHSTPTSSSSALLSPSLMQQESDDMTRDTFSSDLKVTYGAASVTGQRNVNEDRHTAETSVIHDKPIGFFGVFDGHGGSKVSEYLASNLHQTFFNHIKQRPSPSLDRQLKEAMLVTDQAIYDRSIEHGSTAICVAIRENEMAVASLGDSQAILSTYDGQVVDLCASHRPTQASETQRILEAKGTVVNGRIFGVLGVSRAFGDNDFKTSKGAFKDKFNGDLVGGDPEVIHRPLTPNDDFIVLGCDGLFDVMTPEELAQYVRPRLALQSVQKTCEDVVHHALRLGSTDNVSTIIIKFHV
ncbi:phosphatase 2C [Thraustotheca clavata]|uniref:Phosphatase 2C n=1 Tax=Thraustotheca clavata TaxID=74557 RepID=A0A1V9YUP4_9STRA|nr:phosphatase 2C [Thraustotheca clavata]